MTLIHEDGVSFWDIPRLTMDGHDEMAETKDPLFFIAYPSGSGPLEYEENTVYSHYSGLCDWYIGSHQPLWFDYQRHSKLAVHPFVVEITLSTFLTQNHLLLDDLPAFFLPETFGTNLLPSRVVGGKQVRTINYDDGLGPLCHSVQEIDGAPQDVFVEIPLAEERSHVLHDNNSFCPFSGRFCYYLHVVAESSMEIHVVDLYASAT